MAAPLLKTTWSKGSVKDVAESVGIANLPDELAGSLASDVEYRLHEIMEEAIRFMKHSKRGRLTVDDLDWALRQRNLEPLWGFSSSMDPLTYRKVASHQGNLYYVDEEEIDLNKLIANMPNPPAPRDVSFTSHWLAIEGVQPAIPQNPAPAELKALSQSRRQDAKRNQANADGNLLVSHLLSRELQLYFERLTAAVVDPDETMRTAALASLKSDTGLQGLVAYFIQWASERVVSSLATSTAALDQALDLFEAVIANRTLFVEPYLHQMLPSILSILLTAQLGTSTSDAETQNNPDNSATLESPPQSPFTTRKHASALLVAILNRYSNAYASLKPRVLQTLLRALTSGPENGIGTVYGAILGLKALGSSAVQTAFTPENQEKLNTFLDGLLENSAGESMLESDQAKSDEVRESVDAVRAEIEKALQIEA